MAGKISISLEQVHNRGHYNETSVMAPGNMHNMSTLLMRLEVLASRLEDMATYPENPEDSIITSMKPTSVPPHPTSDSTTSVITRSILPSSPQTVNEPLPLPRPIEEFDRFLSTSVGRYVSLSKELGDPLGRQATRLLNAFQEQRKILLLSTKATKPDAMGFQKLIRPMSDAIADIIEIKEHSRGDKTYDHLSSVADGIGVMGWIYVEVSPFRHVDQYLGYSQYFGNKVMKEYKGRDSRHVEWVQSFYQVFRDLSNLVKEYYPYGISWNYNGQSYDLIKTES
ncbi:adenylate cyclase-associated CAP [Whalleya microplaca]|nr:adenylate cyclase-associated CAP [Whalleya microplaca]